VPHPRALSRVLRVRIAFERRHRQPVESVREQVERDDRLVIVPLHDHAVVCPMPDVNSVGQDLLERVLRKDQLIGGIYSPTRADRILPQSYRVHYVFLRFKFTHFELNHMDR